MTQKEIYERITEANDKLVEAFSLLSYVNEMPKSLIEELGMIIDYLQNQIEKREKDLFKEEE